MTTPRKPNRLADETSPYLLQHAGNPVDWYPWGAEALERALAEDKPILLSIGYAACHWCHVMERESFENEAIARVMNEHFVCIKVDREERPDLDDIYMAATIAISGGGGWPMTVFLTPEQAPFFAGTYFPPTDRGGRPGFLALITRIGQLWQQDRDQLFRQAGELTDHLRSQSELEPAQTITAETITRAVAQLSRSFDPEWGGFGDAPKFPPCGALHLLLRVASSKGDDAALKMLHKTLTAMKDGGIYDHVGGGFARYSTDRQWHVPHFEKMLYDNAQLARVYVEAHALTKEPEYERVARETLDYVVREMQSPEGGYYSATDADSEGVEGKFFTFTTAELRAILEPEELRAFCAYYDVSDKGNWEGTNVLRALETPQAVGKRIGLDLDALESLLSRARAKVFTARAQRTPPLLDDKILTAWNGLMIGAMAEAGRVLGSDEYIESAQRAANFVLERLYTEQGRLLRTARGAVAHLNAYLEDYAYLADGLVDLYEASADATALQRAQQLCRVLLEDFSDAATGAFFQTSKHHEQLLVRSRDGNDGALPNANAVAARALYRIGKLLDDAELTTAATAALRAYGQRIERMPRAQLTSLNVLDQMLSPPVELVFAGNFEQTRELRREIARHYLPNRVIAHATTAAASTPLLAGKAPQAGKAALYICRDYHCERPITSPADVASLLRTSSRQAEGARAGALRTDAASGLATLAATANFHERHGTPSSGVAPLWPDGPLVSKLGFGGYRIHEELPDHRRALLLAVTSGCNLIDTAPGYTGGSSERVIGDAIAELVRRGEATRSELVVVGKLGIVETRGQPLPEGAVELAAGLGYCITPAFLEQQLGASLQRLNLDALDVCLLHNPEMLLSAVPAPRAFEAITQALRWLEEQRQRGRIGAYGISSNAWTLQEDAQRVGPPKLALDTVLGIVTDHRLTGFAVLQTPLNPFEHSALSGGVITEASARGLGVLVNRPLNALVDDELWRLADAPTLPGAPEFEAELTTLIALEREFQARLGSVLEAVPDAELRSSELLAWGKRIGPNEISSRALWNEFERGLLAHELPRVLAGLDQSFAGRDLGRVWFDFKRRYTDQLERLVVAARARASAASNERNAPLKRALLASLDAAGAAPTLAQLVLWLVWSLPGVSSVLTGMRAPSYVHDAISTLAWDPVADPESSFDSLRHKIRRVAS